MGLSEFVSLIADCGNEANELSREARREWMWSWRRTYAAPLHHARGKWTLGEFDWHVFSSECSRALNGAKAEDAYRSETAASFLVMPHEQKLPALACQGGTLPSFTGYFVDVYVFPEDLEWTMAFTHEASTSMELGPFFSRREWVALHRRQREP